MATINATLSAQNQLGYQFEGGTTVDTAVATTIAVGTGTASSSPDRHFGFRFQLTGINSGDTVDSAVFTLTKEGNEWKTWQVTAYMDDADNSAALTSGQLATRSKTTANVVVNTNVNHTDGTGVTFNLIAVLQEVIDRPGWTAGSYVTVLLVGEGASNFANKVFHSYSSGTSTDRPKLDVTYTAAGGATYAGTSNGTQAQSASANATVTRQGTAAATQSLTAAAAATRTQLASASATQSLSGSVNGTVGDLLIFSPTTINMGTAGPLDNLSPDGFTWAQGFPMQVDQYGNLIALAQDNSGNKDIDIVYSNDGGATWASTALSQGFLERGSFVVTASGMVHVLWKASATSDGIIYRRYQLSYDGSNNVTGATRDTDINLQLDFGASEYQHPVLLYVESEDAILCLWGALNGTTGQIRASYRKLSNTSADNTASNWIAPVTDDTVGSGQEPAVDYTIVRSISSLGIPYIAAERLPSGDVFVAWAEADSTSGGIDYRRLVWDSVAGDWSNTMGAVTQIIGDYNRSNDTDSGYNLKPQLISKPVYASDDTVWIGFSDWNDGDTWSFIRIDPNDSVSSIVTAYQSADTDNAANNFVTGDLVYDSATDSVVAIYTDLPSHDIYVRAFDGGTHAETQAATLAWQSTDAADIPTTWHGPRYDDGGTDKLLILFRDFNGETPGSWGPPYQGFLVTMEWSPAPTGTTYDGAAADTQGLTAATNGTVTRSGSASTSQSLTAAAAALVTRTAATSATQGLTAAANATRTQLGSASASQAQTAATAATRTQEAAATASQGLDAASSATRTQQATAAGIQDLTADASATVEGAANEYAGSSSATQGLTATASATLSMPSASTATQSVMAASAAFVTRTASAGATQSQTAATAATVTRHGLSAATQDVIAATTPQLAAWATAGGIQSVTAVTVASVTGQRRARLVELTGSARAPIAVAGSARSIALTGSARVIELEGSHDGD